MGEVAFQHGFGGTGASFRPLPNRRQNVLQDVLLHIRTSCRSPTIAHFPRCTQSIQHASQRMPATKRMSIQLGTGPKEFVSTVRISPSVDGHSSHPHNHVSHDELS